MHIRRPGDTVITGKLPREAISDDLTLHVGPSQEKNTFPTPRFQASPTFLSLAELT